MTNISFPEVVPDVYAVIRFKVPYKEMLFEGCVLERYQFQDKQGIVLVVANDTGDNLIMEDDFYYWGLDIGCRLNAANLMDFCYVNDSLFPKEIPKIGARLQIRCKNKNSRIFEVVVLSRVKLKNEFFIFVSGNKNHRFNYKNGKWFDREEEISVFRIFSVDYNRRLLYEG